MDPSPQRLVPLPRWAVVLGTFALVLHFAAVITNVVAAPSGPWMEPDGPQMADPPRLAALVQEPIARHYLIPLKLAHNYHFRTNRRLEYQAELEVNLLDESGKLIKKIRFPDPKAGRGVRHYQQLAASWLVPDDSITRPMGERLAPEGKEAPRVEVWRPEGGDPNSTVLNLDSVEEHLLPRGQSVPRPSDWSMIFIRSYARYLVREHGATSVEVIRHSRAAVPPRYLFDRNMQIGPDRALESNYGRLPR